MSTLLLLVSTYHDGAEVLAQLSASLHEVTHFLHDVMERPPLLAHVLRQQDHVRVCLHGHFESDVARILPTISSRYRWKTLNSHGKQKYYIIENKWRNALKYLQSLLDSLHDRTLTAYSEGITKWGIEQSQVLAI